MTKNYEQEKKNSTKILNDKDIEAILKKTNFMGFNDKIQMVKLKKLKLLEKNIILKFLKIQHKRIKNKK